MAKHESDSVLAKFHKDFGDGIGGVGVEHTQVDRVPTGIFELDLASGGGIPQGRASIIYGPEASGKTTLAMLLLANTQAQLGSTAVIIDAEGTFDYDWGTRCGIDAARLVRLVPDTAEQAVDMIEGMLYAKDVGTVVVDSIAALTTHNEIESDAGKQIVGGSALLVGKLVRKVVSALNSERKRKHTPALVCINQTRTKIGVMYGDPETTPGGQALRFISSMTIRVSGKDVYDKDLHDSLPVFKDSTATLRKWKVPVVAKTAEYKMCLYPHGNLQVGQTNAWNTVSNYLKQKGLLVKGAKGWSCMGQENLKLAHIQTLYETDPKIRALLQKEVVSRMSMWDDMKGMKVDTSTGEILDE